MDRRRLPPLNALRAFEAAARHLSFTRAAEELLITQSAVSHHVRALEDGLGARLFLRRPRGIELTPEGARYFAALKDAFDRMGEATREFGGERRAPVRVALLSSFATNWLVPRLPRLAAARPEVDVRLEPGVGVVDLAAEGIDIAVRYGPAGRAGPRAALLMAEEITPVCSPRLLERGPPIAAPRDLLRHVLLLSHSKEPFEWRLWSEAAGVDLAPARTAMLHDYNIVLQAALDGQGVAMGRRRLVEGRLRRGELVEPLPGHRLSGATGHWIVLPEGGAGPHARAFAAWLRDEAGDEAAGDEAAGDEAEGATA